MAETLNQRWAATIAGVLAGQGVCHAVISPGSRSTPLALALADRPDVRCWSSHDERSAAFFALGLAKGSGRAVAIVCTSGTAGAHALPAVMEACAGATPLILLTADRPWELHGFGAPQTTEQRGLYGGFVRASEALPAPEGVDGALEHLAVVVAKLVDATRRMPRGPVHLNVPFREPLAHPDGLAGPQLDPPVPEFCAAAGLPPLEAISAALVSARRPMIVCGPRERCDGFGAAVHRLGAELGAPVLADAASNARFGFPRAIAHADLLLRHAGFAGAMQPDFVLRFGGGLSSKGLQEWLDRSAARTCVVGDDGLHFDARHRASWLVRAEARAVCEALSGGLTSGAGSAGYDGRFLEADARVNAVLEGPRKGCSEPEVARALVAALPDFAGLVVSSSMPIRDVDTFASRARGPLAVFSNRGLNGIDGVTSTALGVAAATGGPTALLIGDVAALHDLSAWVMAKQHRLSLTVVLVNNDGGGIFSFLPVAGRTPHFEPLFGTPHGVDFAHVAALAGAILHRPSEMAELRRGLASALEGGLHLIELRSERSRNVDEHRALQAAAVEGMGGLAWL
jgi:2-succinyl-5-enolpyruvyl-6-hydroxy-3-cyclohexene-1-carboxylate synthase